MSGLGQIINTGMSGLDAATAALETVSHNTANVNTPGYNVESVQQTEIPGAPGGTGLGVQVTSIQRSYDQFVFSQLVNATAANQAAQVTQNNLQGLTAIFPIASGGSGGLGASLTSFFAGMAGVSQDPTSMANRQAFLGDANALAQNVNSIGNQLASSQGSLNGQLVSGVTEVNTLTQQIANLNAQIEVQTAAGQSPPNALMDSRDNLVLQLGTQLGITVIAGPNNTENVYTTGGAALVAGSTASNLAAASGAYGSGSLSIIYQPTGQNITASLSGGAIGGVIAAQTQIVAAQNSVGAIAVALSNAVNTQQSLGLDLNGALGGNLFSVGGPVVLAANGNTGGGGTLTVSITNTNAFVPGNFIVTKTASGYEATNPATGQTTALGNGPNLSFDGMSVAVSGTINTGDSFEVEPTATAAQTLSVTTSNAAAVAAASPYVATPGSNLGNVTASAFSAAASGALPAGTVTVPAGYFGQNLTVKFTSATTYDVLSAGNTVIASGSYSAASGAEIAIAYPSSAPAGEVAEFSLSPGTPAAGDTFALAPGGSNSNGNIQAMTGLSGQSLLGGATLASAYATLVGQVGSAGQTATFSAQATQGVVNQVQALQQSISGVNLDQQAAELVNFQQAYQASAQVIATARALFQTLLSAIQVA